MLATWELRYTILSFATILVCACLVFAFRSPLGPSEVFTTGVFPILTVAALTMIMIYSRHKSRLFQTKTRLELENSTRIIQEQSSENNHLQHQLHLNEKSSLIGEITSAVAHELNTPLAVVAVGAKAINETFRETVELMASVEKEEWPLIFEILKEIEFRSPELSRLNQLKESGMLEKRYFDITGKELDQKLALDLTSTGVSSTDSTWLEQIGKKENHETILKVIKKMKDLHDFTRSLEHAVTKSSTIIQELKLLVQSPKTGGTDSTTVETTIKKALLLIEQTQPGKLVCRLDQSLNVEWQVEEIRLIQLWFKMLEFICQEINSEQTTEMHVSMLEKADDFHLSLSVKSPMSESIRRIRSSGTVSILQHKDNEGPEFQLSIVQSLLANLNAEISISEWQDSFELYIRIPKSVVLQSK
jgi:signal transduction histidine kinase